MNKLAAVVLLLGTLLGLLGCANECQKLVDEVCPRAGGDSMECRKAHELAARADRDDQETCKTLRGLAQMLPR